MSRNTDKSTGGRPFHDRMRRRLSRSIGAASLPVSVRMRMLKVEFLLAGVRHFLSSIDRWSRRRSTFRGSLRLEYLLSAVAGVKNYVQHVRRRAYVSNVFHRTGRGYPTLNVVRRSHLTTDGPSIVPAHRSRLEAMVSYRASGSPKGPPTSGSFSETNLPIEHVSGRGGNAGNRSVSRDLAVGDVKRPVTARMRENRAWRRALMEGHRSFIPEWTRNPVPAGEGPGLPSRPPRLMPLLQRRVQETKEDVNSRSAPRRPTESTRGQGLRARKGLFQRDMRHRLDRSVHRSFERRTPPKDAAAAGPADVLGPGRIEPSSESDRTAGLTRGGTGLTLVQRVPADPGKFRQTSLSGTRDAGRARSSEDAAFSDPTISLARPRGLVDRPAVSGEPVNHQTMTWIVNEVYAQMEDRLRTEQERRGIF